MNLILVSYDFEASPTKRRQLEEYLNEEHDTLWLMRTVYLVHTEMSAAELARKIDEIAEDHQIMLCVAEVSGYLKTQGLDHNQREWLEQHGF